MGIKNRNFAVLIINNLLQAAGFLCYQDSNGLLEPAKYCNFRFF